MSEWRTLLVNGLWKNNPALVQILGLCPLLAVSNSVINAFGLAIATTFVLILSNVLISLTRHFLRPEIRLPVFVLLIASAVTVAQSFIQAFAYPLFLSLGIYVPLIVTNCAIIARAEAYAVKVPVLPAALDGLFMGLGFSFVLLLLGAMRELLAQGTLFAGADALFGAGAKNWTIHLWQVQNGVTMAVLPAGAFICYALLVAGKNALVTMHGKVRRSGANPYRKAPQATRLPNS